MTKTQCNVLVRERGLVDVEYATVVRTCSLRYLHSLFMQICRARSFVLVAITKPMDAKRQAQRLKFLEYEISRLLQFPGLFPSNTARIRFLILCFHLDSEWQSVNAGSNLLIERQLQSIREKSDQYLVKPTYLKDSKGWENFLLPGAPGSNIGSSKSEPESAFQVLPAVGSRICSDFQREENDILAFAYRNEGSYESLNLRSLPFPVADTLDEVQETCQQSKQSRSRLKYYTRNFMLTPSPFRQDLALRPDSQDHQTRPLHEASSLIYRVEHPGPGSNMPVAALNAPNVFIAMGIRSWHRPWRRWDLQYKKTSSEAKSGPEYSD